MGVALNTTLRAHGISTLLYKGQWDRVVDRKINGEDVFIGAGVTEFGETQPDIALAQINEALLGFVLGYVPQLETIDALGYYYRDYDNKFPDDSWVRVGIPKQGIVIFVLSDTDMTLARGAKILCSNGVWRTTASGQVYQMVVEEPVTGAPLTRKYFYARWVKN